MKRLGVIDLGVEFRALSEIEKRMTIAGDSPSWDCTFNAFINYMSTVQGVTVDKNQLISDYCSYHNCTEKSIKQDGGVTYGNFDEFISNNIKYSVSMKQDSYLDGYGNENYYTKVGGYEASDVMAIELYGKNQPLHTVQPLRAFEEDGVQMLEYYDPTTGQRGIIEFDKVKGSLEFAPKYYGDFPDGETYRDYAYA